MKLRGRREMRLVLRLILILICIIVILIPMSIGARRVAVIGGGISGCNFCSAFRAAVGSSSDEFEIDLYDKGRALGGRASTRRHTHHGDKYVFDHGAQYIGAPKDNKNTEFRRTLDRWREKGYIEKWTCRLGSWDKATGGDSIRDLPDETRYTPTGGFTTLATSLLREGRVSTVLSDSDVSAERAGGGQWSIVSTKTRELIKGGYDHVVFTDRSTVLAHCDAFPLSFISGVRSMQQRPLLSLMIVFDEADSIRLQEAMPFEGIKFFDHPVLGWVGRDSSKEGRQRADSRSCYVLQSQYAFAEELIRSVESELPADSSTDEVRAAVTRSSEQPLLEAFLQVCANTAAEHSRPIFVRGHRWGAAAAMGKQPSIAPLLHCYVDLSSTGVIAVGDYLASRGAGKIEGAVESSYEAAGMLASWYKL